MTRGLGGFVALLLAFCVVLLHPELWAVCVLLLVAVCVAFEDLSRPDEDENRAEEKDEF